MILQHFADLRTHGKLVVRQLEAGLSLVVLPVFLQGARDRLIEGSSECLDASCNRGKVCGFRRLCDQLPDIRGDEVLRAARICSDHRRLACHTLNEDKSERLLERREATKLRNGVDLCQDVLASWAQKQSVLQPQLLAQILQFLDLLLRACAHTQGRKLWELGPEEEIKKLKQSVLQPQLL